MWAPSGRYVVWCGPFCDDRFVGRQVHYGEEVHDQAAAGPQRPAPAPVAHRLPLVAGNQAVARLFVQREPAAEEEEDTTVSKLDENVQRQAPAEEEEEPAEG